MSMLLLQLVTLAGAATMTPTFPYWQDPLTLPAGRENMHLMLLVPLTRHGCGPSRYVTMRMAGDAASQQPRDSTLCPAFAQLKNNFQVTYDLYDTNSNAHGVTRAVLDIVSGKSTAKAVLGPNGSGSCKAASNVLGTFGIPHVSWAATNADLSNKVTYPTFFRVVPPDLELLASMAKFIKNLDFEQKQVNVIYFDADFQSSQQRDFAKSAAAIGLSIAATYKLPNSGSSGAPISAANKIEVGKALDNVRKSGVWVIVLFALNEEEMQFMKMAYDRNMMQKGYAWFLEPGSGAMAGEPKNGKYFAGAFGLLAEALGPRFDAFKTKWATDVKNLQLPEFNDMVICGKKGDSKCIEYGPDFKGWKLGKHETTLQCRGYTAFAHDAMAVLIVAFDRMISAGKNSATITQKDWLDALKELKDPATHFDCLSAGKVGFDEKQDRASAFQIFTHKPNSAIPVAVGKVELGEVKFCAKAGITCNTADISFPYNADTEQPSAGIADKPRGGPDPCAAGTIRLEGIECEPCPTGSYCPKDSTSAIECPVGNYCPEGKSVYERCQAGTYNGKEGSTSTTDCVACSPGSFSQAESQSVCSKCPPGSFAASVGSVKCEPCALATYVTTEGASECLTCPSTFVTANRGSRTVGACVCDEEFFWNRADDVCKKCQKESKCLGGLAVPLIMEGHYAEHVGDGDKAALATQVASKTAGTYVPEATAFKALRIYTCIGFANCPKMAGLEVDGLLGNVNVDQQEYEFGLRAAGKDTCLSPRLGIACQVCEDAYFGANCADCGSYSWGVYVLIVVTPFAMMGVYQATSSPYAVKATAAFQMASTFGIMLMFAQFVSLLGSMNMSWPDVFDIFFNIGAFFLFDLSSIGIGCLVGNSFIAQYWITIALPACLGCMMVVAFFMSKVFPPIGGRNMRMNVDSCLNLIGMIYSALYISLCKIVVANMECIPMPAGEGHYRGSQLMKFREVVCGSPEHDQAMPPMVIGWIVYVIGFFALTSYLNVVAPRAFRHLWFRNRCKFLVNRWRADVWYWGNFYMLRNLLVAASVSWVQNPTEQILLMASIMAFFLMVSSAMMAWKDPNLAYFDNAVSLIVVFACYCGIGMFQLNAEAKRHMMDGDKEALAETTASRNVFKILLLIQLVGTVVVFFMLVAYIANATRPSVQKKQQREDTEHQQHLITGFRLMLEAENFWTALARTVAASTVYDLGNIKIFLQNVEHRLEIELGPGSGKRQKTRLRMSEKGYIPETGESSPRTPSTPGTPNPASVRSSYLSHVSGRLRNSMMENAPITAEGAAMVLRCSTRDDARADAPKVAV